MNPKTEKTPSLASLLSKLSPDQLKIVVEEMAKSAPESLRVLANLADASAPRGYPRFGWTYYPQPVYTNPGFYINSPVFGTTPTYKTNEIYCGTGGSAVSASGPINITDDNNWKSLCTAVTSSKLT